jgi:Putative Ig domain/IPT/TIG domain
MVVFNGKTVSSGDSLSAVIVGAVNPSTASSSDTVAVSTTSDITSVTSCPYFIGAGPAAPCVTALHPASGPASGGSTVTITGMNFTGATAVKFGAAAATGVVVHSATSITATTPSGSGTVDVTVTTPQGTSPKTPADRFKYVKPPSITTTSLPAATVGVAYTATLKASGGKKPYTWSITVGTLPAGLTLNPSTGVISGTPTGTGTSTFTVRVTDSENPTASGTKVLSITVS